MLPIFSRCLAVARSLRRFGRGCVALFVALAVTRQAQGLPVLALDANYSERPNGTVLALAESPGGKVLVWGTFSAVNEVARASLVRLNADGTVDPAFVTNVTGSVNAIAVQADGKVAIAGDFTAVNGFARAGVARLNADGSLDSTFNPGTGPNHTTTLRKLVLLADGRLVLGGDFTQFHGRVRNRIVRLMVDGSVDETFVPFAGSTVGSFSLTDLVVDPDGRVLYSNDGTLTTNGVRPAAVGRLNADGSIDATFTPGVVSGPSHSVDALVLQADGRILVGGGFTRYNGAVRGRIARLNADGALDMTWVPAVASVDPVRRLFSTDEGICVFRRSLFGSGSLAAASAITRLTSDGRQDDLFGITFTSTRTDYAAVLPLAHGGFLIGGDMVVTSGSVTRYGLARLHLAAGPAIATQPHGGYAYGGMRASIGVVVVGGQNLTYQWFHDGVPIGGADQSIYFFTVDSTSAGYWWVRITHAGGTLESNHVQVLYEDRVPTIASFGSRSMPTTFRATMQSGTRFALQAPDLIYGTPPVSYHWLKDGVPIPGATTSRLFRAEWSPADSGDYSVTITNSLGTITSAAAYQGVSDNPPWTWIKPAIQGNPLTTVQSVGGRLLATGQRGTIVDLNGFDSRVHRVGSTTVGPVAFGNGTWVALALAGGVLTSRDGVAWTPRETGYFDGNTFFGIAFAEGKFVVVGALGRVITSTDGIRWTPAVSTPSTESLLGVVHSGTQWVAITYSGRVHTSIDAHTWFRRASLPASVTGFAYGAGRFVAIRRTPGIVYSSSDAVHWETHAFTVTDTSPVVSLQYTEAGFLAALSSRSGRYLVSVDGRDWEERASSTKLVSAPTHLTFARGAYVMTGGSPDTLVMMNDDVIWLRPGTILQPPETRAYASIAASPTIVVAVGNNPSSTSGNTLVSTSNDGLNWAAQSVPTRNGFRAVTYGPPPVNLFVAVGGSIASSPNGVDWTVQPSTGPFAFNAVRYLRGEFIAVGDGGSMWRSTDGRTWVRVTTPTSWPLHQVAYGAGLYVAVGSGSRMLTSADGTTWTERLVGTNRHYVDVIFATGKFVAITAAGEIVTSTDGLNWTTRASHAPDLESIMFAAGRFMAFGSLGYWTSAEGEIWMPAQHGSALRLRKAAEFKSRIIAVGHSGAILALDLPLVTDSPAIIVSAANGAPASGTSVTLTATAPILGTAAIEWQRNGTTVVGARAATLTLNDVQPAAIGMYTATTTGASGSAISPPLVLGLTSSAKVVGAGSEVGTDIVHPNGNIFDQVLLDGAAATITANPGQVTRMSFLDLNEDIVQVEFSGAGSLSLVLDNAQGPALPNRYNQTVRYMRGHAGIVLTGADETTNLSVFSVGRATAINHALFPNGVAYDGIADIAFVAIASRNGRFGGLRAANASFFATRGITGLYAPGVEFTGPIFVYNIAASDAATPAFITGAVADARVTGGDLFQPNARAVQIDALIGIRFTEGTDSHSRPLPAQTYRATFQRNGVDVTADVIR